MLELLGSPVINLEDYNLRELKDYPPTLGESVSASFYSNTALNPTVQGYNLNRLDQLRAKEPSFYIDEMGNQVPVAGAGTLEPASPEAKRLPVEEANAKGEPLGLRFSEPPTQAQFDYLKDLKQAENSRDEVLSQVPTISVRGGLGFVAGFAGSAIDPLNIASAFVPVVGEARYARMVERMGIQRARLAKGALEGGVGNALVVPLVYSQAEALQQNYGPSGALQDIVFGAGLGAGLHWGGGALADLVRKGIDARTRRLLRDSGGNPPDEPGGGAGPGEALDRRKIKVQEGENAAIVESMDRETRSQVLGAAVKAVETDTTPKIDALLKQAPELTSLTIPDKRFPATMRLRNEVTATDFATGTRAAQVFDAAAERMAQGKGGTLSAQKLFDSFASRYKKLSDFSLKMVTPQEFAARAANLIEHPEQRAAVEPGSKTVLVTDGASMGAVRHEIERALDLAYDTSGDAQGGYRYHTKDTEGQTGHRLALRALYEQFPDRSPRKPSPTETTDLFSRRDEPLMGAGDQAASDRAWQEVEQNKDMDLKTMIADEEIAAVEDIANNITGAARDLGIMEKVIPVDERQVLEEAAAKQEKLTAVKTMAKAVDEAVEREVATTALDDAEILMRDGVDALKGIILEGKTTKQAIADAKARNPDLVTRSQALDSVRKLEALRVRQGFTEAPLTGDALDRAIRSIQTGEDINVAIQGAQLLTRADQAAEAPAGAAADFKAPGEDQTVDEMFSDLGDDAVEIVKDIQAKRALAEAEARLIKEEHDLLAANPNTQDLASAIERTEFDEAQRDRALREGSGTVSSSERARARSGSAGTPLEDGLFATRTRRDGEAARGQGVAAERERSTAGGERTAPETALSYGAGAVVRRVITPDSSIEVSVEPRLVELSDLEHATGDLQVRDRSRKESEVEALERALKLDPEQLLPNRVADTGAPIVVANLAGGYTIISGNGRVLSLRKVYGDETLAWKANQYRDRLGGAADGYRHPILVSVITDTLTHDELVKFADRANRSRIAQMSVTEKAQRDADAAGIDLMMLYQGGDFTKKENQPFLRAFMRKVATPQEQGEMSKNGVLTKPGVDRLNAAVLASAYDDTGVLSLMLESTDNNIKSIASAYRDVAPVFMKLRAEIAQGLVREEVDITAEMMAAARFVHDARDNGVKIGNALTQIDALNPLDPVVDRLIRQFYNPQLTRANSALRIGEVLRFYAEGAREKRLGGFFEDQTTPLDVMGAAERRMLRESDEAVLAAEEADSVGSPDQIGQTAPQPAPDQPGANAEDRSAAATEPAPAGQTAEAAPTSLASILNRQGEQGLRAYLGGMKLAEMRDEAKRQKFAHKGRSREQVINAIVDSVTAAKDDRLAAVSGFDSAAEQRAATPVDIKQLERTAPPLEERASAAGTSAHEQLLREEGWINARDDLKIAIEEFASADKYLGKKPEALSALRSMEKKVRYALEKATLGETEAADAALRGAMRDAEELESIEPGPAGKLYTQYVRNAARNRGIEVPPPVNRDPRRAPTPIEQKPFEPTNQTHPKQEEFYNYLEGDKPVKGAATIAKALKIDTETAYKLLDEALAAGWLRQKEDGTYIRTPKNKRPVRPGSSITDFMGDVVGRIQLANDADRLPALHAQRSKSLLALAELDSEMTRFEYQRIDEHGEPVVELRPNLSTEELAAFNDLSRRYDEQLTADDVIEQEIYRIEDRIQKVKDAEQRTLDTNMEWRQLQQKITQLDYEMHEANMKIAAAEGMLEGDPKLSTNFNIMRQAQVRREAHSIAETKLLLAQAEADRLRTKILTEAGFAVPDRIFMPEVLDKLETELNAFMDSGRRNAWIYGDENARGEPAYSLYVRNAMRPDLHGNMVKSLDISSVQVAETGQGRFQQMLDVIERVGHAKGMDILYVENVQTEKFANFFRRLGWDEEPRLARYDEPSFIKRIKPEEHAAPKGWDVIEGNDATLKHTSIELSQLRLKEQDALHELMAASRRPDKLSLETLDLMKRAGAKMDAIKRQITEKQGVFDGLLKIQRSEQLERDLQATLTIQRAVGKALHRVPDVVGFEVHEQLGDNGRFGGAAGAFDPSRGMVMLAKNATRDMFETVNHEIFHALRNLRLFTQFEWDIIKNAYQRALGVEPARQAKYQAYFSEAFSKIPNLTDEAQARLTTDKLVEEWAATDHGEWAKKRHYERETPMGMLHGRVLDFLHDLTRSMENLARRAVGLEQKITAQDIFRAIEDGTIAKRFEEWGGGKGDGNTMSAKSMASDDTADMLNDMMRTISKDEHEKKGRVMEEALKALAPCAIYNL